MSEGPSPVIEEVELGFPWKTFDPFLFCVHHDDAYPAGDERMAPRPEMLRGRNLGMDFTPRDGWRMYHGRTVPGFPQHPHRGFETLTLARHGFIDHSDSLGAKARFGHGDAQWMTAGAGIEHSEMFPLVRGDGPNRTELFQLWINLPRANKMVPPHFAMLWDETIPKLEFVDESGHKTRVALIAGKLGEAQAPTPPPHSWASDERSAMQILTIKMEAGARWTLPALAGDAQGVGRTLYYFEGEGLRVGQRAVGSYRGIRLRPDVDAELVNGTGEKQSEAELLLLQGRAIDEPVVQHGPFVMNTVAEIKQAISDYQRTRFGNWPWGKSDPVHPRDAGRFAVHADGSEEEPAAS